MKLRDSVQVSIRELAQEGKGKQLGRSPSIGGGSGNLSMSSSKKNTPRKDYRKPFEVQTVVTPYQRRGDYTALKSIQKEVSQTKKVSLDLSPFLKRNVAASKDRRTRMRRTTSKNPAEESSQPADAKPEGRRRLSQLERQIAKL